MTRNISLNNTNGWDSESMPCDWNLGIVYPIYRLGCNHYRGNTAYKIFFLIIQDRLVPHVEKIVRNYQRGLPKRKINH